MSALYPQNWTAYLGILLVFIRLLGFFIFVPAFSHTAIPPMVKTAIALAVALALHPLVESTLGPPPSSLDSIVVAALKESVVGFLMGFTAYLTFEAINLASQFIGYQMGFGTAGLVDPQNHANVSVLVPFQSWLLIMVFFFTDMHHQMIELFVLSFNVTSQSTFELSGNTALLTQIIRATAQLFVLAVQLAAPFTFLILACNLGIGILSRMLPQMNVMLFSFPITIMLSFVALYLLAPDMLDYFELRLGEVARQVIDVLRTV